MATRGWNDEAWEYSHTLGMPCASHYRPRRRTAPRWCAEFPVADPMDMALGPHFGCARRPRKKGPACWARKPRGGDFRKVTRRGALGDLQGVKGRVYILFGVQGKMDLGMPDLRTAAD